MSVGPAEAAYRDTGNQVVHRYMDCKYYSACNKIACKNWWPSFTCDACEWAPWYKPPVVEVPTEPCTPRVPLHVFIKRVANEPGERGYTLDNFVPKMSLEVGGYYGGESLEYAYISSQLLLLKASLNNSGRQDLSDLVLIAQSFSSWFSEVPDVRDVYLTMVGRHWSVDS